MKRITAPIQLWNGADDENVPPASNAMALRQALGAKHFTFLAPRAANGPAEICAGAHGFDREAFHRSFNAEVARFFQRTL